MKNISIADKTVSAIALGCMRIGDMPIDEAEKSVLTAYENGISFFDHADIYGEGKCEEVFGKVLSRNKELRSKITIQSKCGIRKNMYDFSKEHIISSVEGSLKRLGIDSLDFLLLHRPDALAEPEEVCEAFNSLKSSGKVKHFGVSNHNPMQIELLQKYSDEKLYINQLQFSITNATMVSSGINVNTENPLAVSRDGSVLDYCRLHNMTIQAWSPFQYGFFKGVFLGCDKFPELNKKINELAEKYNVTNGAIAIAWILRHPANIQPILGTTNPQRISDICKAADIRLTRSEWYDIYLAAGNILP